MTHTTYSSTKIMLITGSVIAFAALAMTTPASAYYMYHNSDDTDVRSSNSASVENDVTVVSNTGYNVAAGGNTGGTGEGGDARGGYATGGDSGNSGDSSTVGTIHTGDSTAIGTIRNDVNRNNTVVVEDCGCYGNGGDIDVRSRNNAYVGNRMGVDSNTGDNAVLGGTSGATGNGGEATSRSSMWHHYMMMYTGTATGGDSGNTGDSNNTGDVVTGNSYADGLTVNVVNRNVTRVR